MRRDRNLFWRNERGATTVEFVLVLPILLMLTLGFINLCALLYSATTLHYAVQDAARCMSVKTAVCSNAATTQTYAQSRYAGPNISANFVATPSTTPYDCEKVTGTGAYNKVAGTGSYKFMTGVATLTVPLSATACFPA